MSKVRYQKSLLPKEFFEKLIYFFDHFCEGEQCQSCETYPPQDKTFRSSRVECKRGVEYTCNHKEHPRNRSISNILLLVEAEDKAFKAAGIETGTVEFTCPLCGGQATASRAPSPYSGDGMLSSFGNYCKGCGMWHS